MNECELFKIMGGSSIGPGEAWTQLAFGKFQRMISPKKIKKKTYFL